MNKVASSGGERRGIYYYITSNGSAFTVYHGRLEPLLQGDLNSSQGDKRRKKNDKITCIEFGADNCSFYLGTEKGLVRKYELPSPLQVQDEKEHYKAEQGEAPEARCLDDRNSTFAISMIPDTVPLSTKDKGVDKSVKKLYRIPGIVNQDVFVVYVKYRGLFIWNET